MIGGAAMKQATFAGLAWGGRSKVTQRERLLGEMGAAMVWCRPGLRSWRSPQRRRGNGDDNPAAESFFSRRPLPVFNLPSGRDS